MTLVVLLGTVYINLYKLKYIIANRLKILKCGIRKKMEEISWKILVKNEGVLLSQGAKESCMQYIEGKLTGFVTSCTGTAV
jgi:hypothetical protein